MACCVVEIEKQVPEILYRFTPDKGIDYCPEQERDEDPGSPPPEELPCLIMKGKLQIG